MIKLIVPDAMQAHRRFWRHHEIECRPGWPAINKRRREPTRRDVFLTDETHAHEPARRVGFELQESANFVGREIITHLFLLNVEHPTPKVFASKHRTSNAEVESSK